MNASTFSGRVTGSTLANPYTVISSAIGTLTGPLHGGANEEVLDMLRELSELTMIEEGDPQSFRVRAYESAAHAIAGRTDDLTLLSSKDLQKIEGIGKSLRETSMEMLME